MHCDTRLTGWTRSQVSSMPVRLGALVSSSEITMGLFAPGLLTYLDINLELSLAMLVLTKEHPPESRAKPP